jgi:hypothetical protein
MTTWSDIRGYVREAGVVIRDGAGAEWSSTDGTLSLFRWVDGELLLWDPADDEPAFLPRAPLPEPPDGTRIEFEHYTDVYAAWRDDTSSIQCGWPAGDGGWVWCLYGETVPKTWDQMWAAFGESLATAVRLVPVAGDEHLRAQWPTALNQAGV